MDTRVRSLERIDWEFADYVGSQFPMDINAMHWYPGTFVPQIPSILVQALSEEGDLVLDPFSGAGTTLIECARLGRRCIGVDINPFAVAIASAKLDALRLNDADWFRRHASAASREASRSNVPDLPVEAPEGMDEASYAEVRRWFEAETLLELLNLRSYIDAQGVDDGRALLRAVFSSILNRVCSQKDHYTYVTDRCFPADLVYRPAGKMFGEQLEILGLAVEGFRSQFLMLHGEEWSPTDVSISRGDSRCLDGVGSGTIDLVVTSPPYLGVNDYVRSMRLTHLFYPDPATEAAIGAEIGARRKRARRAAFDEFVADMEAVLSETARVLRPGAYLCLVFGQGRGKVVREDTVKLLIEYLVDTHGFKLVFERERRVKFRRIQVPGVQTEKIFVLQSPDQGNV